MKQVTFCALLIIFHIVLNEKIEYYPSQGRLNNIESNIVNEKKLITESGKFNNVAYNERKNDKRKFNNVDKPDNKLKKIVEKRAIDPVFYGYPKTREELWSDNFLNESTVFDQRPSLIKLIHNITLTYLKDCTPVLLYDSQIKSKESYLFQNLLKDFPVTFVHGYINDKNQLHEPKLLEPVKECVHFIIFLTDVKVSARIIGKQSESKVVVVARSSQWTVQEFLSSPLSRRFVNLLVIGQSFKEDYDTTLEAPYILYTHKLYTDGLGASQPVVITSWSHGKYSRNVDLFPTKMTEGYAGHRFVVSAANQPPFVFRKVITDLDGGNPRVTWDGIEIRLLKLLAERNNFSIEIVEPQELHLGPSDAVAREIGAGRADIGVAGMYMTMERVREMDVTFAHSQDCAVFITLMSTALPRYRAILGPFNWRVWVALTFTYILGMFPLAFSDKHTLRHLLNDSGEIENLFWYVFGTFTNCFTFAGKNSWSKTTKITTRLLIGWYWIFTIIITSCYTGSIIAFVTLPIFPETVDTIEQLLAGFYRIGTLDHGGWERWFINSSDPNTNKLMKKLELVSNVGAGIGNTTKAFFFPYAFLGSRAELEYIVQANFSKTTSKRAMLHISNECFVPFGVTIGFPKNSLYTSKLSHDIRSMFQTGIIDKIVDEVRWEMQRSSTGKHLAAASDSLKVVSVEEKGLTLEDTQGMFLLLAAGFLIAATALISEWMGGFSRKCRFTKKGRKPRTLDSEEDLITPPDNKEISAICDTTESVLRFGTRSFSARSQDTLEGEIINVTEDDIMVHENFDTERWDSRRSSSFDLDREVKEIFEKDNSRREVLEEIDNNIEHRLGTASNGAFGDHINNRYRLYRLSRHTPTVAPRVQQDRQGHAQKWHRVVKHSESHRGPNLSFTPQ